MRRALRRTNGLAIMLGMSSGSRSGAGKRRLPLSATELSGFFECEHSTWLNLGVLRGERERPGRNELERWMLEYRGRAHEQRLLDAYRRQGLQILELSPAPPSDEAALARAAAETLAGLEGGVDLVYQGTLRHGDWSGRPDFLKKVSGQSRFGDFHYEVVDAKLARHAQARGILQLCVYTEQLGVLQQRLPDRFWIAIGGSLSVSDISGSDETQETRTPIECRTLDYLAYYRQARARFERFVTEAELAEPYPEPVEHCDICQWWKHCETRCRADDHVSLVAGSTRRQRERLARAGVTTAAELARLEPERSIPGIDAAPLTRLREQARLQVAARGTGHSSYELLPDPERGAGLERLPLPTPGDLFLDLEGDAYALGEGLEYLFGLLELGEPSLDWSRRTAPGAPRYHAYWSQTRAEEKRAFEAVMRRIERGLAEFPGLHVFHFGQREVDALRRLSCRHASSEEQVDRLLRGHVLVDLHAVVRQSLRASVESYTLKQLEALYGFARATEPRRAALSMQRYGFWLETGEALSDLEEERAVLERYNAEDCKSAWQLRDWLEERRREFERTTGRVLARLEAPGQDAPEAKKERSAEAEAVVEELQLGLPIDAAEDSDEQRARRVLSHLVGWHWREQKSAWWEYFRAKELPPTERLEDRQVLGGLSEPELLRSVDRSHVYRYRFPEQEHAIRRGRPQDPDTDKDVQVVEIGAAHVDVKRGKTSKQPHPRALAPGKPLNTSSQEQSVLAIAQSVARRGWSSPEFPSARALLTRCPPTCGQLTGAALLAPTEDTVQGVVRLALALESGVLAVQGPPGSGKTHRAAAAIVALIRAGKRVGVTANSHPVITDLLRKCCQFAQSDGTPIAAHHIDDADTSGEEGPGVPSPATPFSEHRDYALVLAGLQQGSLQLVGATSFAWSREEYRASLDVLVVDEAAQISLANVIAVSAAAPRLILFGDPAQLEQPQRGVHPLGAGVSALEYLLGDALTMPPALGVFLAETRRLHPDVCEFTSRVFYEGRLQPLPGLELQRIVQEASSVAAANADAELAALTGSGLRFVPVLHRGNTHRSDEEVERIAEVVGKLLGGGVEFSDAAGERQPLEPRHILVVAPYNAQVTALRRRLEPQIRVGTVDKFQGREAPIVIYSMTSSSAADAPRGFEFLYSLNRLNVATSRAQALVILVASPELTKAHCRSPRQMQLVNALCSFLELVPALEQ
jgi:predicted RecB family nuclease